MKLNSISYVSAFLLVLSKSLMAMEEENISSKNPSELKNSKTVDDEWKRLYLKKKYLFSQQSLDVFKLLVGIKTESLSSTQVETLLIEASDRGESDAQAKLYDFYKGSHSGMLTSSTKANSLLQKATNQGQLWAYREQAKKVRTLKERKKWYYLLANRGDKTAVTTILEEFLEKHEKTILTSYNFAAQYLLNPTIDPSFKETYIALCKENNFPEPLFQVVRILRSQPNFNESVKNLCIELLKHGAKMGHVECMFYLYVLADGLLQETNLRRAADLGHEGAMDLISLLLKDKGKNEEALKYARRGAETGNSKLIINCGRIYNSLKQYEDALPYFLQAGQNKCKEGWIFAAEIYEILNIEEKSLEMHLMAANAGDAMSALNVGIFYLKKAQPNEALIWFQNAESLELGSLYLEDLWFSKGRAFMDLKEYTSAIEWFEKVKNSKGWNGAAAAYLTLGQKEKGEKLLLKAALRNNLAAIENLIHFYLIEENYPLVLFWAKIAEDLGSLKGKVVIKLAENVFEQEEKIFSRELQSVSVDDLDREIEEWDVQMQTQLGVSQCEDVLQEESIDDVKEESSEILSKNEPLAMVKPNRKEGLNTKGLREKFKKLGQAHKHKAEISKKVPKKLDSELTSIILALLTEKDNHIDIAAVNKLFSDSFFQDRVTMSKTKSGWKVIVYDELNKCVLKAGTHKKHGKEKFTGKLHPAFRKDLRKILVALGFAKENLK